MRSNEAEAGQRPDPQDASSEFRRIRIEVPNMHGNLRGKVVPAEKIYGPRGLHFCNAFFALDVDDLLFESPHACPDNGWEDVVAVPDLSTLRPVPWETDLGAVLCDWRTTTGDVHPLCQRAAVRAASQRLADLGLDAKVGLEFEIFAFSADPDLIASGRYEELKRLSHLKQAYSFQRWPAMSRLAERVFDELGPYGAVVESFHTELGRGVIEVALKAATPLEAADAAARLRLGLKEIATQEEVVVTFMAKVHRYEPGSSGHIHLSLHREGRSAMWSAENELSSEGMSCIEGLLQATPELAAIYGPYYNSYRRPDVAFWAPTRTDWGYDNRLTCVRALAFDQESARVEQRRPGADLSIYLAVAGSLAAGAYGIENELRVRPESPRAGGDARTELIPSTLYTATERLRESELARELLGGEMVDYYSYGLDAEIHAVEDSLANVTSWELRRYLETV